MSLSSIFSGASKDAAPDQPAAAQQPPAHPLDALTGGVFSAATSGERAQRVREWLATGPSAEQMQQVYKELSSKDKGAAKALREKLDELRRASRQQSIAAEWQEKAQALLAAPRLNIADAMAWQRDAAKAGAPLSQEPLASLRTQLAQRIKVIEDVQQQLMVQRETALLLAQRIELLSTRSWRDAQAQHAALQGDVEACRATRQQLAAGEHYGSVDVRYITPLDDAHAKLLAVWEAFSAALAQAVAADADAAAPLPSVPVWAEELRAARAPAAPAAESAEAAASAPVDPEAAATAEKSVKAGVMLLEKATSEGHSKNINSAIQTLRHMLKEHEALLGAALKAQAHKALDAASELSGWQRWSADKLRQQLIARAEGLLRRQKKKGAAAPEAAQEPAAPAAEPAEPAESAEAVTPAEAPVEAPAPETAAPEAVSESIPETAPAEAAAVEAPAVETPAETAQETPADAAPAETSTETPAETPAEAPAPAPKAAAQAALADDEEWVPALSMPKMQETIRQLREEWKTADQGGPSNQQLWLRFDRACNAAYAFVEQWVQRTRAEVAEHKAQRQALIEELKAWGEAHAADTDWKAIARQLAEFRRRWFDGARQGHLPARLYSELQAQWKAALNTASAALHAAQKQSIARRRALITEAGELAAAAQLRIDAIKELQQRWQAEAQSVPLLDRQHEQKLWNAFRKPLDEAFQRRSQQRTRQQAALNAHDQAVLDAAKALEEATASGDAARIRAAMQALHAAQAADIKPAEGAADAPVAESAPAPEQPAADASASAAEGEGGGEAAPAVKPARRPVVAMRGDDRPGMRRGTSMQRDERRGGQRDGRDGRKGRDGEPRRGRDARGPRLGGAAFHAQREAMEHAQSQLKKLAAQAHGEALTAVLQAWQERDAAKLPSAQQLGAPITGAIRNAWAAALQGDATGDAAEALLRLEIAAEVPTPAAHQPARRALQLQLLTRRGDAMPADTWPHDAATALAAPASEESAQRLQAALKALLRAR